tara:strand:- start:2011 stop:2421 length:411 start_codon:yes stop_codon:yes gene_type:complete
MNIEGIINITGKPGLFKVISTTNNSIIVESLIDGKRRPVSNQSKVNMLEEICLYTYNDTKPLTEIFNKIALKEKDKQTINHKNSKKDLTNYFREILPEYDEDRVYISDIKKVIQWYNLLQSLNLIKSKKEENNNNK